MIYEVELIRTFDGAFEVIDIEANSPEEAYEIVLEESILIYPTIGWAIAVDGSMDIGLQKLGAFRQAIIRDEDGREVYNQLYSESI